MQECCSEQEQLPWCLQDGSLPCLMSSPTWWTKGRRINSSAPSPSLFHSKALMERRSRWKEATWSQEIGSSHHLCQALFSAAVTWKKPTLQAHHLESKGQTSEYLWRGPKHRLEHSDQLLDFLFHFLCVSLGHYSLQHLICCVGELERIEQMNIHPESTLKKRRHVLGMFSLRTVFSVHPHVTNSAWEICSHTEHFQLWPQSHNSASNFSLIQELRALKNEAGSGYL